LPGTIFITQEAFLHRTSFINMTPYLAEQFHCICLVTDLNNIASLVANEYFNVIVVTDTMGDMNKDFFSDLRI